jgi:tetratricopeptide (TPR) repeat protein
MMRVIRELRRREVFRTAGLYVGIAWILIEGASVLLDAFNAPDWFLRALIIVAVIGLPITIVLAWIFDISEGRIEVQAEATDTVVIPFGGRKGDFVVIGVLSVALVFSIYLNITSDGDTVTEEIEPLSILIADFDNQTGDPLFEGSLEQALQIGLEGAAFVSSFERGVAKKIADQMRSSEELDSEAAQLVAVREGIKLVLAGSIIPDGSRFDLAVRAVAPRTGEIVAEADVTAPSKLEVLTAMGELAADLRAKLGDESVDRDDLEITETFTAMSLEAVREYDAAQQLQYNAKYEEAIDHYRAAIEHDPDFGRAYSGWAVAARNLGLIDEAAEAWEQAMAHLGSMSERERLRTQGIYYWGVTRNFPKAIETYEALVEKYPADFVGHNNLAVARFYALDFDGAADQGQRALEIYPANAIARTNFAIYAMYKGDFSTAVAAADEARKIDAEAFKAWLPVAMQALANGEFDTARGAYASMRETNPRGASTASLGLADVELFAGDPVSAREALIAAIGQDTETGNAYGAAVKWLALAEAFLAEGDTAAAQEAVGDGLELVRTDATQVPAALLYMRTGEIGAALDIAASLEEKLSPQSRAYAGMIRGVAQLQAGEHLLAIEQLTAARETADLWLLRFYLGRAYFEGGYFVEALDEFTAARERHGEASAVFLDDLPSYRYMATLPYWLARAQSELGMTMEAARNFNIFIARRRPDEPLAEDARQRLQ